MGWSSPQTWIVSVWPSQVIVLSCICFPLVHDEWPQTEQLETHEFIRSQFCRAEIWANLSSLCRVLWAETNAPTRWGSCLGTLRKTSLPGSFKSKAKSNPLRTTRGFSYFLSRGPSISAAENLFLTTSHSCFTSLWPLLPLGQRKLCFSRTQGSWIRPARITFLWITC